MNLAEAKNVATRGGGPFTAFMRAASALVELQQAMGGP
jgi:hypothetical protein